MAKGKGGDNEGANPEEFNVPEALSEAELKSLNALLHKLPIPHLDDLKEHQKECCCCCCCGKDNATGPGTAANFDFNPSLTIYAIPFFRIAARDLAYRGNIFVERPCWHSSVTLEWERYNSLGQRIQGFQPLGPDYTGLSPSGFAAWDTGYTFSLGHRVHIRAITDQGVTSRVRWRDGNGGAGWL